MADETLQTLPAIQNLDYHVVTLFQHMETMRKEELARSPLKPKQSMQAELLTLEFWRSTSSECLTSFLYVFLVCGAAAGAGVGASVSSVLLATALASGLTIAALTQVFAQLSGAHINPSVSIGMAIVRAISPLRAAFYITAQCGGGIAGAAVLYGVTVPGYQGNLQSAISDNSALGAWERLTVELILTFVVVLTFMSVHDHKSFYGSSAMAIGAAYTACSFVSMPYLNPARALGPAFVFHKWDNHWVYWVGPLTGGLVAGFVFKYLINPKRTSKLNKTSLDTDSASLQSDDDINYDLDMDNNKSNGGGNNGGMPVAKYHGGNAQGYRANGGGSNNGNGVHAQRGGGGGGGNAGGERDREYCPQNMYTTAPPGGGGKVEQSEPLYGGTRSMYCKSPPLTRSNLNRSQSVYTKSQTAINRDFGSRPGPLVPAQSLYPMRVPGGNGGSGAGQNGGGPNQSHLQNQNVQNQMHQRSESIYGIRGQQQQQMQMKGERPQQQQQQHMPQHMQGVLDGPGFQPVYGTRGNAISMGDGLCNKYGEKDAGREMRDDTTNMQMLAANTSLTLSGRPSPHRPESMYGLTTAGHNSSNGHQHHHQQQQPQHHLAGRRGHSAHSDDSSYGSYHDHPGPSVTPPTRKPSTSAVAGINGTPLVHMQSSAMMPMDAVIAQQQQQQNGGAVGYSSQQQQIRFQPERKGSSSSGPTATAAAATPASAAGACDTRQVIYGTSMKQQHPGMMQVAVPAGSPMGGGGGGGVPPPMPHHQYGGGGMPPTGVRSQ